MPIFGAQTKIGKLLTGLVFSSFRSQQLDCSRLPRFSSLFIFGCAIMGNAPFTQNSLLAQATCFYFLLISRFYSVAFAIIRSLLPFGVGQK